MRNIGIFDRLLRVFIAEFIAFGSYLFLNSWWAIGGYVIAGLIALESIFGMCFLYKLMGKNTCDVKESKFKKAMMCMSIAIVFLGGIFWIAVQDAQAGFVSRFEGMVGKLHEISYAIEQGDARKAEASWEGLMSEYKKLMSNYFLYARVIKDAETYKIDFEYQRSSAELIGEKIKSGNLESARLKTNEVLYAFENVWNRIGLSTRIILVSQLTPAIVEFQKNVEEGKSDVVYSGCSQIADQIHALASTLPELENPRFINSFDTLCNASARGEKNLSDFGKDFFGTFDEIKEMSE